MYLFVRVPVHMRLWSQKKTFRSSVRYFHDVGSRTELTLSGLEASVSARRAFTAFLGESSFRALFRGIHPIRNVQPTSLTLLAIFRRKLGAHDAESSTVDSYRATLHVCELYTWRSMWTYLVFCLALQLQGLSVVRIFLIHIIITLCSHILPLCLSPSHVSPGHFRLFLFLLLDSPPLCLFILCIPSPSFTPVP